MLTPSTFTDWISKVKYVTLIRAKFLQPTPKTKKVTIKLGPESQTLREGIVQTPLKFATWRPKSDHFRIFSQLDKKFAPP